MRNFTLTLVSLFFLMLQPVSGTSFLNLSDNNLDSIMEFLSSSERAQLAPVSHTFKRSNQRVNDFENSLSDEIIEKLLKAETKEDIERAFRIIHHLCFISPRALELASRWTKHLGRFVSDQKIEVSARLLGLNEKIDHNKKFEMPPFPITSSGILTAFKKLKRETQPFSPEHVKLVTSESHFINANFVSNDIGEIVGFRHTFEYPIWIEGSFVFVFPHQTFEIIQHTNIGLEKGLQFENKGFLKISKKRRKSFDPVIFVKMGHKLHCSYQGKECDFYMAPNVRFFSHTNMPEDFRESSDLVVHGNFLF